MCALFFDESETYMWRALDAASARRDFNSVQYWMSQILIHRAKHKDVPSVITF